MQREKRDHSRIRIDREAHIEYPGTPQFRVTLRDISVGGVFVASAQEVPYGTELNIVITFPDEPQPRTLSGVVRWAKPGGFGVQFGLLGAKETHAVTRLMKSAVPSTD
jgi:type IV pilus assembly protein PilZ